MRAGVIGLFTAESVPASCCVDGPFEDGADGEDGDDDADDEAPDGEGDALSDPSVTSPPPVQAASAKVKRAAPRTRFDLVFMMSTHRAADVPVVARCESAVIRGPGAAMSSDRMTADRSLSHDTG